MTSPPSSPPRSTRPSAATRGHKREWVVLIDGNNTQIEAVTAEAARRGITITIVIDFIHVLEYLLEGRLVLFRQGRARRRGMGR